MQTSAEHDAERNEVPLGMEPFAGTHARPPSVDVARVGLAGFGSKLIPAAAQRSAAPQPTDVRFAPRKGEG